MPDDREPAGGGLGLGLVAAVGVAACCGLPLLVAAGVALSAVGAALGSGIMIAVGVALAVWGWRRRAAHRCETPQPPGRANTSSIEPPHSQRASHNPGQREPRR